MGITIMKITFAYLESMPSKCIRAFPKSRLRICPRFAAYAHSSQRSVVWLSSQTEIGAKSDFRPLWQLVHHRNDLVPLEAPVRINLVGVVQVQHFHRNILNLRIANECKWINTRRTDQNHQ